MAFFAPGEVYFSLHLIRPHLDMYTYKSVELPVV